MAPNTLDRDLRLRIEAFVQDLTALVKTSALGAVRSALGGEDARAVPAARGRAAVRGPSAPRRGRRGKRSSEEVAQAGGRLLEYIRSHPGERLEQIGAGMGVGTKELKLPVQKLLGESSI